MFKQIKFNNIMYLKPMISPESTKYVEAEHEKEEGDNRKAENINQPLKG